MQEKKKHKDKKRRRKIVDYFSVIVWTMVTITFVVVASQTMIKTIPRDGELSYSEFMSMVDNGEIESVLQTDGEDTLTVYDVDGNTYSVIDAEYDEFRKDLLEKGVTIQTRQLTPRDALSSVIALLPTLLLTAAFLLYLVKTMNVSNKHIFTVLENGGNVTFDDIAGMDNIKEEVETAVETLVSARKLGSVGARPIKGILLNGEPGCGKTMIAKAIAGEAKVPFISCSGSDFVEMFIGVGAARIRSLWKLAEINAPCVVFIDEIDALGRNRKSQHEESNRTLNALLQRMDGLNTTSGILVIGATNMLSEIDPALLRSGRFDKKISISSSRTTEERKKIMEIHLRNKKVSDDFDKDRAAKLFNGMTGADIENVLNDAVLISLSNDRYGVINFSDVERAALKLRTSGVESSSKYTERDKRIVAVHEAGHAIVAKALGRTVDRVSIQAYSSGVGGLTQIDSDNDDIFKTAQQYKEDICILLGGLVAEELMLGSSTFGCASDLHKATELAYNMCFNWGMMGSTITVPFDKLSDKDKSQIDSLLGDRRDFTKQLLIDNKDSLISLVNKLMEAEVVYDV